MRVLIVDDNNDKVCSLIKVLTEMNIDRENIAVCYTVSDAMKYLRKEYFDLLILDVVLPLRAGESPSSRSSLTLLTELSERSTLHKPAKIIGVTAYDDAITESGPVFQKNTWYVLKFSLDSDEWKKQLASCASYILSSEKKMEGRSYKTDLCMITALQKTEFEALMRMGWQFDTPIPLDDTVFIRRGFFQSGGKNFSVVAAHAPRMGMVSSALLTAKLIERETPRFVAMAGICAGITGKSNFGDAVIASLNWDWQAGKHFVDPEGTKGFAIEPDPIPLAGFMKAKAQLLRSNHSLLNEIRSNWPSPPETALKIEIGPMASGSAVVADAALVEEIKKQNRTIQAIEMEAFAVAAAAANASFPRPTTLICKSVCDFGDSVKDDKWQTYAAYTSAQVIKSFFETYMIDIHHLSGTI